MSQVILPVHTEKYNKFLRDKMVVAKNEFRALLRYNKFLRDKMVVAKNEFRALLRETKKITCRLVEPLPHCIT